jgi:hypothetical protein
MSVILKQLLKPKIEDALSSFGTDEYTGPDDPASAQSRFADKLSTAVAEAVQQYINTNVLAIPAPGPVTHAHKLQAL